MILNRERDKHHKKSKNKVIKNTNEEEYEEEEEDIEEKEFKNNKKKHHKKRKRDYEEEEEEEEEENEEVYEPPKKKKKFISKNTLFYIIVIAAILVILLIIFLIIKSLKGNGENNTTNISLVNTSNGPNASGITPQASNDNQNQNQNQENKENNENRENKDNNENKGNNENKENKDNDPDKERITKEMKDLYEQQGYLNIIQFDKEKILKQEYKIDENAQKLKQIHISVGITDAKINTYIKHIASILSHADKEKTFLHIHMMDAGEFNYDTFKKLSKMIYNINNLTEIIVYNANSAVKDFTTRAERVDKFPEEYAKLYVFKALKDIKKIIFLNGDNIMVQKDLGELYDLNMDDIYARGISEEPGLINPMDWYDKYIMDKSHFINCGVLLINLELCQKDSFYQKAIELNNADFYTKTECPVQDILNVLMRKKIEFFHPKYNKINFYENPADKDDESKWYSYMQQTIKMGEKNNHFYTKEELLEADQDPVIVHYYWDQALNKVIVKYEEEKRNYAKLSGLDE